MDIVGEAMLRLIRVGEREGGVTLPALLNWVLPSGNNLQFLYLEGGEGNHQFKDCHYLNKV